MRKNPSANQNGERGGSFFPAALFTVSLYFKAKLALAIAFLLARACCGKYLFVRKFNDRFVIHVSI